MIVILFSTYKDGSNLERIASETVALHKNIIHEDEYEIKSSN